MNEDPASKRGIATDYVDPRDEDDLEALLESLDERDQAVVALAAQLGCVPIGLQEDGDGHAQ